MSIDNNSNHPHEWALLLFFPTLAFLYSFSSIVAYAYLFEFRFMDQAPNIIYRLTYLVVCIAVNYHHPESLTTESGIVRLLGMIGAATISWMLIQQTREETILEHCQSKMADLYKKLKKQEQKAGSKTEEKMTVLITGANTGIGYETVHQLIQLGLCSKIILACRNPTATLQAIQTLQLAQRNDDTQTTKLEFLQCDLSNLSSVQQAIVEKLPTLLDKGETIDVLINNAGILMHQKKYTSGDNLEFMMQVNVIGHFLLTRLLFKHGYLQQKECRILNLTSSQHKLACHNGGLSLEDLHCRNRPYTLFGQYSQTKLANIYMTQEFLRRYGNSGTKLVCYSIHPGIVRTYGITRNLPGFMKYGNMAFGFLVSWFQKTPAEGAWSTVHCATYPIINSSNEGDPQLPFPNGCYVSNCKREVLSPIATNSKDAQKLWDLCEEWTKKYCV